MSRAHCTVAYGSHRCADAHCRVASLAALEDLREAQTLDPHNADVAKQLKHARALQKKVDEEQMGMFTKMIGNGELL
jgi:hypothetical protein